MPMVAVSVGCVGGGKAAAIYWSVRVLMQGKVSPGTYDARNVIPPFPTEQHGDHGICRPAAERARKKQARAVRR